jgi:hypothetical protein
MRKIKKEIWKVVIKFDSFSLIAIIIFTEIQSAVSFLFLFKKKENIGQQIV